MASHHHPILVPRTRLLVVSTVGVLIALLAAVRILLPTMGVLAQFFQFSPLIRAALLVKVLSPLLSGGVAAGWTWILLLAGERLLVRWEASAVTDHQEISQRQTSSLPLSSSHLPRSVPSPALPREPRPLGEAYEHLPLSAQPPLFPHDPTHLWQHAHLPVTPLPVINPAWTAPVDHQEACDEMFHEEEKSGEEKTPLKLIEPLLQLLESTGVSQEQEQDVPEKQVSHEEERIALHTPGETTETIRPITLTMLKQMRVWLRADDGTTMEVKLRSGENAIRLLLLAYIAWRKGELVDRDKLLTHVLARGKRRDMTTDQLSEVFDAAKKYLRQDLGRAINEMEHAGHRVTGEIDFFANEPGFYRLHPTCRVVDLETIEEHYQAIQSARKEGLLDEKPDGSIPAWVVGACQKLIDAYPGDFLQELIEKFPEECGSWMREPFTFYRDRYLDALLVLATDESAQGRHTFDEHLSREQNEAQRRRHGARAAQLFYDYAMYAIKSAWDRKLKFAYRAGKDGERVIRAARAIRRCVVELGKLGQPDSIDQVYLAFKERMAIVSEGHWKPDTDTENDVADAKKTTSAYRFSSQIAATHQNHLTKEP